MFIKNMEKSSEKDLCFTSKMTIINLCINSYKRYEFNKEEVQQWQDQNSTKICLREAWNTM